MHAVNHLASMISSIWKRYMMSLSNIIKWIWKWGNRMVSYFHIFQEVFGRLQHTKGAVEYMYHHYVCFCKVRVLEFRFIETTGFGRVCKIYLLRLPMTKSYFISLRVRLWPYIPVNSLNIWRITRLKWNLKKSY